MSKLTVTERHLRALRRAYAKLNHTKPGSVLSDVMAQASYRELVAVVRSVLPGPYTRARIGLLMDNAVKAVCRVIRRRSKEAFVP